MTKYEERQIELLAYLNDNDITPVCGIDAIADIFDIEYIPETGWWIIQED